MELHSSPISPFVRMVRVALAETGLEEEVALVETKVSPVERNADYAQDVPLRQVPALRLDDGTVLPDSTLILLWVDERSGGRLLPNGTARWPVLARYKHAHGVMETAVNLRYEQVLRPEPLRWQAWIDDRKDKIDTSLGWLAEAPTPAGAVLDLAQIGLGCALGYLDFRFPDLPWRDRHPGLAAWYAELAARPSMQATVPVA